MILSMSLEHNAALASNLKDLGWPTLVVPGIEDINSISEIISENITQRKMILLSEIKSKNIQVVIAPHTLIMEFESIKIIICLDPPEDTLSFLRRINVDSITIVFGTEEKLHPMIDICQTYDAMAVPLPNIIPVNHATPPRNKREYTGITISEQDMNNYREMARKARNIKHLMDTETWTHPRHQDISKKIIQWQKEVRKALLEKDTNKEDPSSTTATTTESGDPPTDTTNHVHTQPNTTTQYTNFRNQSD